VGLKSHRQIEKKKWNRKRKRQFNKSFFFANQNNKKLDRNFLSEMKDFSTLERIANQKESASMCVWENQGESNKLP